MSYLETFQDKMVNVVTQDGRVIVVRYVAHVFGSFPIASFSPSLFSLHTPLVYSIIYIYSTSTIHCFLAGWCGRNMSKPSMAMPSSTSRAG